MEHVKVGIDGCQMVNFPVRDFNFIQRRDDCRNRIVELIKPIQIGRISSGGGGGDE